MKKSFYCILLALWCSCTWAQDKQDWTGIIHEMGIFDEENQTDQEAAWLTLSNLAEHKIDLNSATREDLEQIPFLSETQIEEICEYLYRYGPMKSMGELAMIESLDFEQRKLLSYFTEIKDIQPKGFPSMKNILKYGKHELMGNLHVPFYKCDGDRSGYLGYPYKHSLRYSFQYGEYVKAGLIGAQDAGEPFFSNRNKYGYDYYSFYLQVRKWGKVKSLVLGRYRMNIGMGLVMNSNFGLGKAATLMAWGQSAKQIRPHSSRTEGNYLQGAATTVQVSRRVDATAFVSYRYLDATLNADSSSVSSIVESGYHRSMTEMNKKHNTTEWLIGGNINYRSKIFHGGITGISNHLNRELKPNTSQRYRQYYPSGKHFWNVSADYGFNVGNWHFTGETATGDSHALATVNSLVWKPSSSVSLMALQRFYSYKYYALHSEGFSEGGTIQDESGIYMGFNWQPNRQWLIRMYSDFAYFPWPKYQADNASHAWDNFFSTTYSQGASTWSARYRWKMREKDNDDKTALLYRHEHRGRLSYMYESQHWSFKTQADASLTFHTTNSFGWMITQNVNYHYRHLSVNASLAYFHTDDYNSRIYGYEKQPLYSFSFPAYSGEGIRYTLFVRQDILPHWMLIAKIGVTNYFDRKEIGTGLQTIRQSSKTDLDLQFRWKF